MGNTNETQFTVNGRTWKGSNIGGISSWTSNWICTDGDVAELYINDSDFDILCFSGIAASSIEINKHDFITLWNKVYANSENKPSISEYTFEQQCIIIADYLCSLFCEWSDIEPNNVNSK
jgi:hypothetical protein